MIISYIGRRGAGKTLTMVKDIINFHQKGWKIYTNFPLFGIEHRELTNDEIIELIHNEKINNCVLAIDELQTLLDSRKSMKKANMDFSYFIQQIRKRGMVLMSTQQFMDNVEKRFRQHVDIIVKPNAMKLPSGSMVVSVDYMDTTTEQDLGYIDTKSIVYDPSNVFDVYDTTQEQKSINL